MNISQILRTPINTDRELHALAKKIGINNLNIVYLYDYKDNMSNNPTIINLGSRLNGGTHFVAVYKDQYFDSFGQIPPHFQNLDKKQWVEIQIQSINEGHCGVYALMFLYYAIHGEIDKFYSIFKPLNVI